MDTGVNAGVIQDGLSLSRLHLYHLALILPDMQDDSRRVLIARVYFISAGTRLLACVPSNQPLHAVNFFRSVLNRVRR